MSILNGFLILVCSASFIFILTSNLSKSKHQLPFSISVSLIIFCIFVAQLEPFRNYKVSINKEYISFQALYHTKEPTKYNKYEWKNINMVIIGNVTVKTSRISYTVFGVQIIYTNEIDEISKSYFKVSSLEHLVNYEELINNIKKKCIENNIKNPK